MYHLQAHFTSTNWAPSSIRSIPLCRWQDLWQVPLTIIYGNMPERNEYHLSSNLPSSKTEAGSNSLPALRYRTPLFTPLKWLCYHQRFLQTQIEWKHHFQWRSPYQRTRAFWKAFDTLFPYIASAPLLPMCCLHHVRRTLWFRRSELHHLSRYGTR